MTRLSFQDWHFRMAKAHIIERSIISACMRRRPDKPLGKAQRNALPAMVKQLWAERAEAEDWIAAQMWAQQTDKLPLLYTMIGERARDHYKAYMRHAEGVR